MVFCYSATQKSKAYAELLGDMLSCPVHMMDTKLDPSSRLSFYLAAVFKKSQSDVLNLPDKIDAKEIYVVGPIWAGEPARPLKHFLENAPIKGIRVNMLLTAAVSHIKYAEGAKKLLEKLELSCGEIHVFATPAEGIDKEISKEQIQELFCLV